MNLCVQLLYSQNDTILGLSSNLLEKYDDIEEHEANEKPIIRKSYNDSCYVEQHFFPNGNIYYQVPIINGKQNGIKEYYYPNGQLKTRFEMKDDEKVEPSFSITYDRYGHCKYVCGTIIFRNRMYFCTTDFFFSKRYSIMIHIIPKGKTTSNFTYKQLAAEFVFDESKNKWILRPHHAKPVIYAKRLLHAYKKEWEKRLPNMEF